jgi:DNA-binding FrmR family transcriptional regulator
MARRPSKVSKEEGDRICAEVLTLVRAVGAAMEGKSKEVKGRDPIEDAPEAVTVMDRHQRRRNAAAYSSLKREH